MALPNASTLNNIYINGVLNPQWNDNGGSFGLDPLTGLPFVIATPSPSYFSASTYNISASNFAAKIVPAPSGTGTVQTSLVIQHDKNNYVEMHVGPDGYFNAYITNAGVPTPIGGNFPAYDPVAHAYWRIRNDRLRFYFETAPDGSTWTTQGSTSFSWDATSVTIMFFAGFTGIEAPNLKAYISNINANTVSTTLSVRTHDIAAVRGTLIVTNPNALSGKVSGFSNRQSKFHAQLGIPQGGLTDFSISQDVGFVTPSDPAQNRTVNAFLPTMVGAAGGLGSWVRAYATNTTPTAYRDGTYWPKSSGILPVVGTASSPDNGTNLFTNVQVEKAIGPFNRLSVNASYYTDTCEYVPQKSTFTIGAGSDFVTRSNDIALAGIYSGKMHFIGNSATDGAGHNAYWPYPTMRAIIPIINNVLGQETLRGTVSLSTQRANTQWYAAIILYDANFNILSQTTFKAASVTNINTHPGGGAWQTGLVTMPTGAPTAVYAAVVPVVITTGVTAPQETVYMAGHSLVGITPAISSYPSTYESPNTLKITVKPDRLNYVTNSGFIADINNWTKASGSVTGSPDPLTVSWDNTTGFNSTSSLKAAYAAPSGTWVGFPGGMVGPASQLVILGTNAMPIIQGLKIGHTYNFSAWIQQGPNCPDVFMNIIDPNYNGVYGVGLNNIKNTTPSETVNGWTRISTIFTIPPGGLTDYRLWFTVRATDILPLAPFNFWVDAILVEETTSSAGSYFDGNFSSPDYQFENQGNQYNRSYYYKDYTNKISKLNTTLARFLPVNTTFRILSAQPPT